MEGLFRLLLVAGLLAAVLPAAAATFGPQPGPPCEPTLLATQVALFCAPYMPSAQCCEPVVAAVDLRGGVPCLCRVAAEPQLGMAGLNATHLLTLYTSCGGLRPGGAHLAAACEGPASVVSVPLPSSGPRRKQPADEAPPLPPSTEKLSPPPQQHDGAAHSKAVLAYVATSPLAPVAAISLAAPHPPHSAVSFELISTAADGLSNGCVHVQDFSTAIAVQCGLAPSEEHCCTILRRVIDPAEVDICICLISQQEAIKQSGLTARHIVQSYATCRHIRPGDVHFSSRGCLKGYFSS
uniref:Uncharacterized protein n=1 Tax=Avena sativa TaxID=4498 RepID=A0ACD5TMQ8_AVESA